MNNELFHTNKTLNCRGALIDLSRPKVMGIINVTPDSFYAGSRQVDVKSILTQAEKMLSEGATFWMWEDTLPPGRSGCFCWRRKQASTSGHSGDRQAISKAFISIDTFRSSIAKQAVEAGACIVNDISGGELDKQMFSTIAELQVPYILMHMRGTPQTMKQLTDYEDLIKDMMDYFHPKVYQLRLMGVKDCIVDVGFGFSKTIDQNFKLLNHLDYFKMLEKPLLVGLSRKSMIWQTLKTDAEHALNGTTSLHTIALLKGASIFRVHDVKEAVETIELVGTYNGSW